MSFGLPTNVITREIEFKYTQHTAKPVRGPSACPFIESEDENRLQSFISIKGKTKKHCEKLDKSGECALFLARLAIKFPKLCVNLGKDEG